MKDGDIKEESRSLEDMLKQIRNIMSDNSDKKNEDKTTDTDDVLELSESFIIGKKEQPSAENSTKNNDPKLNDVNHRSNKQEYRTDHTEVNITKEKLNDDYKASEKHEYYSNKHKQSDKIKDDNTIGNTRDTSDKEVFKNNKKTLVSEKNAEASANAFKGFMEQVSKNKEKPLSFRNGSTVEELIIELIKPELGKWLNENLPNIVQKVVENEVKKLIPKDND